MAQQLLLEKAVILPWACKVFLQSYGPKYSNTLKSAKVTIETGESKLLFSGKWLLHQLISYLNSGGSRIFERGLQFQLDKNASSV